ncbi:MAG: GNAT family N-acetyltransferase [Pseudozobellia sp.]|nr:GNAT family N-acetyltransferase [Pseudozobellia sp.]MBG49277.1 GNAT family N-acetyltransferase [Pseudozobellia sp.]
MSESQDFFIGVTKRDELPIVINLFKEVMSFQGQNGYKVWQEIDEGAIEKEIADSKQYKICEGDQILCLFSIQLSDPFIWGEDEAESAIYLHRIVVHPKFKGRRLFSKVLSWAREFALKNQLNYIRMDTWADNLQLISYYKSFGFGQVRTTKTSDSPELPVQNRNLEIVLLQQKVENV